MEIKIVNHCMKNSLSFVNKNEFKIFNTAKNGKMEMINTLTVRKNRDIRPYTLLSMLKIFPPTWIVTCKGYRQKTAKVLLALYPAHLCQGCLGAPWSLNTNDICLEDLISHPAYMMPSKQAC